MPLTADDRKKLLGRGGLARVARKTRRTPSHVTHVNKNPTARRDQKVIDEIASRITRKNPQIAQADVWPELLAG